MSKHKTSTQTVHHLDPAQCQMSPELQKFQKHMPWDAEEKASVFQSIKENGVRDPVKGYFQDGKFFITSGWTRREAALKHGLKLPAIESAIKPDARNEEVVFENTNRRTITTSHRRNLAIQMLKENSILSNGRIGLAVGLDSGTVKNYRRELERSGQLKKVDTMVSTSGAMRRATRAVPVSEKIQKLRERIKHNDGKIDELTKINVDCARLVFSLGGTVSPKYGAIPRRK